MLSLGLEKYYETLARYRVLFPKVCEGKDDIEILLYRHTITEAEAAKLRKKLEKGKKVGERVLPYITKTVKTKVRPYSEKQIEKMCQAAKRDLINDGMDCGGCEHDLAENLLRDDPRVKAFFDKRGVEHQFQIEALADYFA